MKVDSVEPIKMVRTRRAYFLCGLCGRPVVRNRSSCSFCGVDLDWERFKRDSIERRVKGD